MTRPPIYYFVLYTTEDNNGVDPHHFKHSRLTIEVMVEPRDQLDIEQVVPKQTKTASGGGKSHFDMYVAINHQRKILRQTL